MRIGDVATATGLETQAIRFYERKGLLPPPGRSPNGYRVYDASTITRLEFIRSGQGAGLTLAEIAAILELRDDGDTPCAHVRTLLTAKLRDVHTRQQQLDALETELDTLIRRSDHLDPADCNDTQICHIITPTRRRGPAGRPAYRTTKQRHNVLDTSAPGVNPPHITPQPDTCPGLGRRDKGHRGDRRGRSTGSARWERR